MSRFIVPFLLAAVTSTLLGASNDNTRVTPAALVREMNLARQNPSVYASYIQEMRSRFNGTGLLLPSGAQIRTKEGTRAVDETLRFLNHSRPLPALTLSPGMCRAAADHCADQAGGRRGHDGSDHSNPGDRISRYGNWGGAWGENIAYGKTSARDIVIALIIDDGIPGRKHRKNIFSPKFNYAGAAFGPHALYRSVCSIDFAGSYLEHGALHPESLVARNP